MAGGAKLPGGWDWGSGDGPLPGLPWETKPPGDWLSRMDPDDFTKRRLEKAEKDEAERNKILDREDELELEEYLSDERKNRAAEAERRRGRFGLVPARDPGLLTRLGSAGLRGISTLGRFAPGALAYGLLSGRGGSSYPGMERATGPEMFSLPHTSTPMYGPGAYRSFPADPALALDRSLSTEAAREEFAKSLRSWEERPMIATDPSTDPKYDPTPEIDPETGAVLTYSLDKSRLVGDISTVAGRAYEATQPQPVDYTFGTDTGVNTTGFSMGQYGVDAQGNMVKSSVEDRPPHYMSAEDIIASSVSERAKGADTIGTRGKLAEMERRDEEYDKLFVDPVLPGLRDRTLISTVWDALTKETPFTLEGSGTGPRGPMVGGLDFFEGYPGMQPGDTGVNTTGFSFGQGGVGPKGVMVPTMTSALQQSINVGASDPNAPAGQVDIDASPTGWAPGQALVDRFGNPVTLSSDPQSVAAANYRSFLAEMGMNEMGQPLGEPAAPDPADLIGPSYADERAELEAAQKAVANALANPDINVATTVAEQIAETEAMLGSMGLTGATAAAAQQAMTGSSGYITPDQIAGLVAAQQEQDRAVAAASAAAAAASAASSGGDWGGEDTGVTAGPAGAPQGAHHAGSDVSKAVDRAVQNAIIDALIGAVGPGESALSDIYSGELGYGGAFAGGTGAEGLNGDGMGGFGGGWT